MDCPICKSEVEIILTHKSEDGTRTPEVGFCKKCRLVVVLVDKIKVMAMSKGE